MFSKNCSLMLYKKCFFIKHQLFVECLVVNILHISNASLATFKTNDARDRNKSAHVASEAVGGGMRLLA